MKLFVNKTVKKLDRIRCDACNSLCSNEFDIHNAASITAYWGYSSKLDGTSYDIDLCENCFKDVIQLLQTKRKLWAKDDSNNPLYGSLKYE